MRSTSSVPLVALVAALAVALGAACSADTTRQAGVVRVVAAENFWGDIARQIGGDHAHVTSIITDPGSDPHQYESDARNAAAVADADLVIENGAGYDDFVAKLLSGTSNRGRVVVSAADVLHATGDGTNPHLWYDIPRVPEVARAIEIALAAADPNDRALFAANLKTFVASLQPLRRMIAEIKRAYPGAPVAYTERVPGYLLDAAGLTIASPPGFARAIENGNEPSAGDTQTMNDLLSNHRVRALVYNAQATSVVTQHVAELARNSQVPVVAVTETQPPGEASYQGWQRRQLESLLAALRGGR